MPKSRNPKSRRPRQHRRHKKGLTMVQKSQVQRLIRGTEEVKVCRYVATSNLFSFANSAANCYAVGSNLIPVSPYAGLCQINQGSGDSQRIGNTIRTRYVKLKLNIWAAPYDATNNPTPKPFFVKIWVFKGKISSQASDIQSLMFNNFMDNNSSSAGLTGTITDMTGRVNKDAVTLHKVLIRKVGVSETFSGGGGGVVAANFYANNDFRLNQFIVLDLTRYVYKDILYNDNDNTPRTPVTWVFVEAIPYDSVTATFGNVPGMLNYGIEYGYTDS